MKKDSNIDFIICPGCVTVYKRDKLAAKYKELPKDKRLFSCSCGYECPEWPYRPLTIREIMNGRTHDGTYNSVDLVRYTHTIALLLASHYM